MEQNKLFYNICKDLWSFSKTLGKNRSEMTDEDWQNAISNMDSLSDKYGALGDKERDLISSLIMDILNYIEKR